MDANHSNVYMLIKALVVEYLVAVIDHDAQYRFIRIRTHFVPPADHLPAHSFTKV